MKVQSIEEVKTELEKANIKICFSRFPGPNGFHLVYPCYNSYQVNAVKGTDFKKVNDFMTQFENINITINQ